jgi:hypothetical protein
LDGADDDESYIPSAKITRDRKINYSVKTSLWWAWKNLTDRISEPERLGYNQGYHQNKLQENYGASKLNNIEPQPEPSQPQTKSSQPQTKSPKPQNMFAKSSEPPETRSEPQKTRSKPQKTPTWVAFLLTKKALKRKKLAQTQKSPIDEEMRTEFKKDKRKWMD